MIIETFKNLEFKDFAGDNNDVTYFTKARCVVGVIAAMAFKAGNFTITGYDVATYPLIRKQLDRALSVKPIIELNSVFKCGYEHLLRILEKCYTLNEVYEEEHRPDAHGSLSRALIQISYSTLYKRIKKYEKFNPENSLCSLIKL